MGFSLRIHLSHLYRMLRPELVHTNPEPLCSDAASGFVSQESDADDHIRVIDFCLLSSFCLESHRVLKRPLLE